jgi:hypothetical protein
MGTLLDLASLVVVPSGYKEDIIYSVVPTDGSGDLDFTRASNATRVNSAGLIEKVRTNVNLHSNDFSNANWQKLANATVSATRVADPFGGNTAWQFIYDGTATGRIEQTVIAAVQKYTFSIWLRVASGTATVNLGVGAAGSNFTVTTTWQRFSITEDSVVSFVYPRVRCDSALTIQAYGAQTEISDFGPTDYIPTTTAAVSVGMTADVPRLDYLGSSCPSLLLEPQRTNLLTFSEQIDNSAWTKTLLTVGANLAVSPDGYTNADKMQEIEGVGGNKEISQSFSQIAGAKSYSVFVKKDERSEFLIITTGGGLAADVTGFNLITKTVTSGSGSIVDYGNDWFRCTQFFTTTDNTSVTIRIRLLQSGGSIYTGVGGYGLFVWGNQVEEGAYATSYIPTLGTSVTRVADAATKTGISSLFGANTGTIYFETIYYPETNIGGGERFVYAQEATSDGFIRLWQDLVGGNQQFRMLVNDGGAQQANASVNVSTFLSTTEPSVIKWAMAYEANRFVTYINGAERMIDTSGTAPTISEINFNATFQTLMPLAQALVFPTALSDTQLAQLTTL